jgi:cytochrome c-type biogenesis protein CcsB
MKKLNSILFSPITMAFLLLVLIIVLAVATFVENDFGAEVAKMKVYNTHWLELIFLLLTVNLVGRVFKLKLYQPKKFTIFLFHIAFVIMILGAAITRYFGVEGSMHIREGESSSTLITDAKQEAIELPFSLHLDNFEITRYPGSMSPSSFSSYVTINEKGKEAKPFHIYMNNILKHRGYRFYQSSYDQDEHGTILSVNSDPWGTTITYLGYFVLLVGMVLSLVNSHSFFRKTTLKEAKATIILLLLFFGGLTSASAQSSTFRVDEKQVVSAKHAEEFGALLIQNPKGRTEPVYTYASELMRKLSRKEKMFGLTPVQLFMEMNMAPDKWVDAPLIKVSNKELAAKLGIIGKYAAYSDFVHQGVSYKLHDLVEQVYAKSPTERSKFDKEVIKADEKVNICYALFTGQFLKLLPVKGVGDDHTWYVTEEAASLAKSPDDSLFLAQIVPVYFQTLASAKQNGDYAKAGQYLAGLKKYQRQNTPYTLPSESKIGMEIGYYKYNVFQKLFPFYATIGLVFLFVLIAFIVVGRQLPLWLKRSFYLIILAGFLFHTYGIAVRWYISGHAPMSNGYESMLFVSWVTLLAGFLFSRNSPLVLSATSVLGGFTLMVANLSFMDPVITNLVPVLQSYWLTIHVSVITASYGFLGLGALLAIINMVLMLLQRAKNEHRIAETIRSLTLINHKTIILGLYFLTAGTFLGAVWANESWGRYWGWDPKETWALISVLVYTLVSHARLIPGIKGVFAFNALALWGFSSILMTYFGVNYYLSGLHSYAAGDPVPVPTFVYYSVAVLVALTLAAYFKYKEARH